LCGAVIQLGMLLSTLLHCNEPHEALLAGSANTEHASTLCIVGSDYIICLMWLVAIGLHL